MAVPRAAHFPNTRLGGQAFNHSQSRGAEEEYDRLRNLAREEHSKQQRCFDQAHQAYERGDGAAAHDLSQEGQAHKQRMQDYNRQASEYIFRENNAPGRVADDTIDLHGQFVEEAEDILETRIRAAQNSGQTHLHVIVGKGNHSVNHVQKIKPRVEQICRELGLQYHTEENAGRIYVNLTGGAAVPPPQHYGGGGGGQAGYPGQHGYPQQQHQQPPPQQQFDQGNQQEQELERSLLKCLKGCCTIM